jgi:hypothetical protein
MQRAMLQFDVKACGSADSVELFEDQLMGKGGRREGSADIREEIGELVNQVAWMVGGLLDYFTWVKRECQVDQFTFVRRPEWLVDQLTFVK